MNAPASSSPSATPTAAPRRVASLDRFAIGTIAALLVAVATLSPPPLGVTYATGFAVILILVGLYGWGFLLKLPSAREARWVAYIVGGLGVAAAVWGKPLWIAIIAAVAIFASFFAEMLRQPPRTNLVEQASGQYVGAVLALCTSGWIFLPRITNGDLWGITAGAILMVGEFVNFLFKGTTRESLRPVIVTVTASVFGYICNLPVSGWALMAIAYSLLAWGLSHSLRRSPSRTTTAFAFTLIPHMAFGVVAALVAYASV